MKTAATVFRRMQHSCVPRNQLEILRTAMCEAHSRVLSTSALPSGDASHETHHESAKMVDEGGGSTLSFHEKRDEVVGTTNSQTEFAEQKWQEGMETAAEKGKGTAGVAQSVSESVGNQAKKEMDTSNDMAKNIPEKVAETTEELKDVEIEGAKAVKRDAGRVAEKMGLEKAAETAEELKEVGVEAGKAAKRDAGRLAEKMGLGNATETAEELKEVGIEAGKAAKRDAGRLAEKIGLKQPN